MLRAPFCVCWYDVRFDNHDLNVNEIGVNVHMYVHTYLTLLLYKGKTYVCKYHFVKAVLSSFSNLAKTNSVCLYLAGLRLASYAPRVGASAPCYLIFHDRASHSALSSPNTTAAAYCVN